MFQKEDDTETHRLTAAINSIVNKQKINKRNNLTALKKKHLFKKKKRFIKINVHSTPKYNNPFEKYILDIHLLITQNSGVIKLRKNLTKQCYPDFPSPKRKQELGCSGKT